MSPAPGSRGPFSRLRGSISFRLALTYGLLAVLTTLILLVFVYVQVIGALNTQYFRQITAAAQRLMVEFEEGGRAKLVKAIELTLSDRIDSEKEVYLLLDENRRRLAGNMDGLPQVPGVREDVLESMQRVISEGLITQDGKSVQARLKMEPLPDGAILLVGQDLSEANDIRKLIGHALIAAVALALLLVLLGTIIFWRELELRVGAIRRTAAEISAGQLSRRIPLSHGEDEFTLLGRDINAMLDRIETLMQGARHISDTIAHNLRTPLTRIVGRLRTAQRAGHIQAEILEANQFAIDEIEKLNALFGKLLQIAEIEVGVQRQTFVPCQLSSIVSDVAEMYETLAEEQGLALSLGTMEQVVVHGDADLLASALANLVDNAVKYARTHIRIEVTAHAGQACVTVRDDGPGLPPDEHGKVVRHFYRLDPSPTGYGLGLPSVLAVTSLHRGRLDFADAGPGLLAKLYLPIHAGSEFLPRADGARRET